MRHVTTVVGATGLLGGRICEHLVAADVPVRALVRPTSAPDRVERLARAGVEPRRGELKDPASLDAVCEGARAVISTASSTLSRQAGDSIQSVDLNGQLALVKAARRAGVEHFVLISFAPLQGRFPLQDAKRAVEEALRRSGIPRYTVLQPSYFTEVWLSPALGFDYRNARARLFGTGHGGMNWISVEDVARAAVKALTSPRAWNAVLELGGEEALGQLDVVHLFEQWSGRSWTLEHVPEQELREQCIGATDPLQRSFAALMLNVALGAPVDPRPAMEALSLRPSRLRDYVARVVAEQSLPQREPQMS
ncbi:SDR family oxidoreductase [Archangium violaceum]|uniref:SDR family oxidoreductase n=1 Tax=Archangium violaceum TaxID=83451 RepID=UPI00193B6449|nr:SDR family oxidoreductase [Archangium violaceum]QRK07260.1 SDR family oxidoreductase [Archangium violaceum]